MSGVGAGGPIGVGRNDGATEHGADIGIEDQIARVDLARDRRAVAVPLSGIDQTVAAPASDRDAKLAPGESEPLTTTIDGKVVLAGGGPGQGPGVGSKLEGSIGLRSQTLRRTTFEGFAALRLFSYLVGVGLQSAPGGGRT